MDVVDQGRRLVTGTARASSAREPSPKSVERRPNSEDEDEGEDEDGRR